MKKTLLFACAFPLLTGGCSDSQTEPPGPEPEQPTLTLRCDDAHVNLSDKGRNAVMEVPAEGLEAVLFTVETNQQSFDVLTDPENQWVSLDKEAFTLRVTVAQNTAAESRDCRIRLTAPIRGGGNPRPLKR